MPLDGVSEWNAPESPCVVMPSDVKYCSASRAVRILDSGVSWRWRSVCSAGPVTAQVVALTATVGALAVNHAAAAALARVPPCAAWMYTGRVRLMLFISSHVGSRFSKNWIAEIGPMVVDELVDGHAGRVQLRDVRAVFGERLRDHEDVLHADVPTRPVADEHDVVVRVDDARGSRSYRAGRSP